MPGITPETLIAQHNTKREGDISIWDKYFDEKNDVFLDLSTYEEGDLMKPNGFGKSPTLLLNTSEDKNGKTALKKPGRFSFNVHLPGISLLPTSSKESYIQAGVKNIVETKKPGIFRIYAGPETKKYNYQIMFNRPNEETIAFIKALRIVQCIYTIGTFKKVFEKDIKSVGNMWKLIKDGDKPFNEMVENISLAISDEDGMKSKEPTWPSDLKVTKELKDRYKNKKLLKNKIRPFENMKFYPSVDPGDKGDFYKARGVAFRNSQVGMYIDTKKRNKRSFPLMDIFDIKKYKLFEKKGLNCRWQDADCNIGILFEMSAGQTYGLRMSVMVNCVLGDRLISGGQEVTDTNGKAIKKGSIDDISFDDDNDGDDNEDNDSDNEEEDGEEISSDEGGEFMSDGGAED